MKKTLSILVITLLLFVGSISLTNAENKVTSNTFIASIFTSISDFFDGLVGNYTSTTTEPEQSEIPLYKPVIDYETAVTNAVEQANKSVVSIVITKDLQTIDQCRYEVPDQFKQFFSAPFELYRPCLGETQNVEVGGGSGFIVSEDGLIVTNKHVISDEEAEYTVFTNDGESFEAQVEAVDSVQDIAILKIESNNSFVSAVLGDSDSIKLGQTAIAIGNSLGEFRNTVSVGVVSGLSRNITAAGQGLVEKIEGVIQTDAAINQGNSGGPLLNLKGEVIGMNTAVAQDAQNIGFAIPVNRIKRDIHSLEATGEIKIPFLGVRYLQINPSLEEEYDLPVNYGALVRGSQSGPAVTPNSAAAKAGLQAEDIILEINSTEINNKNSLGLLIQRYNIGETITLTVLRNEEEITLQTTLTERPTENQ